MGIGIMEVTLIEARGLKNADLIGKIDPYVLVQYRDQEKKSHVVPKHGDKVEWNEKLRFRIEYPLMKEDDHVQYKLCLKIMDRDRFGQDDFLGQANIYLKELLEIGMEEGKSELPPQKYRVVSADQTYRGEIKVAITFTAKKESRQIYGGWKDGKF